MIFLRIYRGWSVFCNCGNGSKKQKCHWKHGHSCILLHLLLFFFTSSKCHLSMILIKYKHWGISGEENEPKLILDFSMMGIKLGWHICFSRGCLGGSMIFSILFNKIEVHYLFSGIFFIAIKFYHQFLSFSKKTVDVKDPVSCELFYCWILLVKSLLIFIVI